MRFLRVAVTAFVLGTLLAAVPAAAPPPARGLGPLPKCELLDVMTTPRGYDDWATTLVDWILSVGPDYKPPDLVSVHKAGVGGEGLIREVALADLTALEKAAEAKGHHLSSFSAYRSYDQQEKLFNIYAKGYGYDDAAKFSHRPGHSEHQLGLTIDFVARGDTHMTSNWEVTPTGGWMAKNAWKFGWVMSYPNVPFETICFNYEPWHYRYVGRDLAQKIHDSGLTTREYLWANFTQLDASGNPIATPTPVPPSPTVAPSVEASPVAPSLDASSPAASPVASAPPVDAANTLPGLDPAIAIAGLLIVLASLGLVYSVRRGRRSSGARGSPRA